MQILRLFLAVLCFAVWGAGGTEAQLSSTERGYYQAWLKTAQRAELVIDEDRASSASLEVLRREIADHREVFARKTRNPARQAPLWVLDIHYPSQVIVVSFQGESLTIQIILKLFHSSDRRQQLQLTRIPLLLCVCRRP